MVQDYYQSQTLLDVLHDGGPLKSGFAKFLISLLSLMPRSKNCLLLHPTVPPELEICNKIVQATFEWMILSLKNQRSPGLLVKLYSKMGKKFIGAILRQKELHAAFFDNFLFLFSDPVNDECIADTTALWLKMISFVDQNSDLLPHNLKLFERLVILLTRKCQLPLKFYMDYQTELQEETQEHDPPTSISHHLEIKLNARKLCSEVIKDLRKVIAPKDLLVAISELIKATNITRVYQYKDSHFKTIPLEVQESLSIFESCLHLINGIMDAISTTCDM